jgi:hypothetical protein
MNSIFSTYSTGENRVTASFLAVLRSLSLDRMQKLIGSLLEQSEFELARFENQPAKGGKGVPDAMILSNIRLLIETKIVRNALDAKQIKRHLERLDEVKELSRQLLLITPDETRPSILDSIDDQRVAWTSFSLLDQAIDSLLDDKYEVISEREEFLLRELQNMLVAEGLVASATDVVVVAARNAWPEYQQISAYVCQPNRPFQQVSRIAFYSKGQIYPLVPKILDSRNEVVIKKGVHDGLLGVLVDRLIDEKRRTEDETFKVLLLSAPDSPDTLKLPQPILNNSKSKTGKPTAFTMSQRYVASASLLTAKYTSDLVSEPT